MKRVLAAVFVTLAAFNLATGQKKSTVFGDAWTGVVVSADETTREITIKYAEKGETKTFTGVLVEGYTAKTKDGGSQEIKVSDIPVGTRARLFARTRERETATGKVKFNSVFRIDLLGRDEFSRLRAALNLEPSAPVSLNDSGRLPAANPLKLHLVSENEWSSKALTLWLREWNEKQAAKYGTLEIVPSLAEADASLVVLGGAENMLITPFVIGPDGRDYFFPPVTVFLSIRKGDGLEVLWKQVLMTSANTPPTGKSRMTAEIEKRLKAGLKK